MLSAQLARPTDRAVTRCLKSFVQRDAVPRLHRRVAPRCPDTPQEFRCPTLNQRATRVGGIVDQIDDGVNGLLVDDPDDLASFGVVVVRLLGDAAYTRADRDFLGDLHLERWGRVIATLLS